MPDTDPLTAGGPNGWPQGDARLGSLEEPNFVWLLVALIVLLTGNALMPDGLLGDMVLSASVVIVGLATVPLLPARRGVHVSHVALCVGSLLFLWLGPQLQNVLVAAFARLSLVGFFVSVAVWTIWHLIRARRVTAETLIGAVSGYLLLGIAFTMLLTVVEMLNPGALHLGVPTGASIATKASDIVYFSFITLTTIGYGDIVPASDVARLLVMAEGIMGQFYIAAVVARLISLQVSARGEGPA